MHGISIGLAIDISCCADIRVCAQDTRFAVKEVDIGLAADIGTLARLPKVVGSQSWVKDVCLTARDFGAAEALAVGFVTRVHESKAAALAAAVETARFIASKSPVAVQGTKELLNHARDHTVEDSTYSYRLATWFVFASKATNDCRSAVHGRLECGRPPDRRCGGGFDVRSEEEDAHIREAVSRGMCRNVLLVFKAAVPVV
jgi:delta(3,5)-delta(2,4)-dienoyl-CoA isomerase